MHSFLKSRTSAFLFVLLVSIFLFFFRLGDRGFRNPDEGRYAEIAKEMLVQNNWLTPKLYGVSYFKKPILFYWLLILSFKMLGFSEFAARLVPATFGILGALATFLFARRLFGLKTAVLAGLVLATNFWYLQVGRYLVIDMVFSFFVTAAFYAFYLGITETKRKKMWYLLCCASLAFSLLAKGPAGLVIFTFAIGAYLLFTKQAGKIFSEIPFIGGIVIFSLIALPWFVWMSLTEPEFLKIFFIHEHLARVVSNEFEHQEAWYYYGVLVPLILFPWTAFFGPLKSALGADKPDAGKKPKLFLLLSSVCVVFFFSLSKAKLATYILPSVPFLSVLIGQGLKEWVEVKEFECARRRIAMGIFGLCSAAAGGVILLVPWYVVDYVEDLPQGIGASIRWIAGAVLLGSASALLFIWRREKEKLVYSLIFMMAFASIAFSFAMDIVNVDYTTKPFAAALKPKLQDKDEVFVYDHPGPFYDFRFYLDYPVRLVGLEGELKFMQNDEKAKAATVTKEEFARILAQGERFYCLLRKSDFLDIDPALRRRRVIIKEDARKVLFQ